MTRRDPPKGASQITATTQSIHTHRTTRDRFFVADTNPAVEAILRVEAVAKVLTCMVQGDVAVDPEMLVVTASLLAEAICWAREAQAVAA